MSSVTDSPVAIITGASSGIGHATATRLAQRGYRTLLIARRTDRLDTLARALTAHAPSQAVTLDLAHPAAAEDWLKAWVHRQGPVSVLVNNAGIGQYELFLEQSPKDHQRIMDVNYFAPTALIRAALPGMVEQGYGRIINVCSITTRMATWGHAGYCASKNALLALSQTLEAEHGHQGIHFCCVNPGVVKTEFFDDPRYAPLSAQIQKHGINPQRVARAIAKLIDRPRLEVSVPRLYRVVDWLRALSPGATHRLFANSSRVTGDRDEAHPPASDTARAWGDP